MRRLELNFQQSPDRPRKTAGWLLLLTGLALLTEVSVSYDRLLHDRTKMYHEIVASKLNLDTSHQEPTSPLFVDKDFEGAQQIIARLSMPWDAFFAGLESVNTEDVAILVIEPDIKTGLLSLQGEAKDYAAVLTLIARLREIKPFSAVFLLHHEIKRDDPQHPVGFTLSMRWVKPS